MNDLAQTVLMSDGTILFLKAIGGVLTGLLVASGHLDASNADAFSQDIVTAGGVILSLVSGWVLLEHAYHSAMAELKWNYTPDPKTNASTTTTVTPAPTTETPAQPVA